MGKKEEITDVITPEGYAKLKKGDILNFAEATLKITKKAQGRIWAEHVSTPVDVEVGMSHYGHNVDASDPGVPFCTDCGVPINELATEKGDVKASLRRAPNREVRRSILKRHKDIPEGEIVDGPTE